MANNSIEEVKTVIRGLLVSSPVEVTVLKLRRDFKAQEGQDIPFYEFGFHDVTTFLRSMPDVCKVCNNESGPYAIVKLVESVKSAHVSSLVLRQKTTFKGKRRHSSVPIRAKPPRMCVKPAISSFRKKNGPLPFEVPKNGYLPKTDFSFSSSNEVSNKNHHNLPDLPVYNSVHQSCNGYDNNVETWLYGNEEQSEVQEVYPCIPDASGSEFVDLEPIVDHHLRDILISDEGLSLKDVEEYLKDALSASETNYGNLNAVNFEQIIRNLPYIRILDNYIYHEQFLTSEYEEVLPEESFNRPESPVAEIKESLEVKSSKIGGKGELTVHASPFVPQGVNEKVHRLERNLHSLMKDNVHGILGSELREKYKMKFAAPLNFQILGCENTQELAFKMPHIFSYIPLENGDFKLYPYGYPKERNSKEDSRSRMMIQVPEITKRNMVWLMQGYPNGLNSKDFEQTYKDTYLQGIDFKQMGLSSIEEFFQSLEKLNVIKIEVSGSDTWLFPSNNSANLIVFDKPLPFKEIIENEHDLRNMKEQFPRDVVGPDLHVKQVEIPSWVTKGSLIEVLVQEVNNPHHFWLTFCGEQYSRALDSLMDDLQAFYCSKSHSYRMPSEFIREGQDCVTQYVDEWHRARVTSIISATEVEVCFYDYGTRRVVLKDNIHYLHTAHSALPAQAIRAVLANIAPVGDKWTPDASKRFLHLIANKALIGIVISADFTNKLFSLFLCDTSGDDDIYIHEVLISEGYAVETGFDYNEKESNKIDINDVKTEGAINSGSLLMKEEECEEKQPNESCGNLDVHIESPPVLNSINHDDTSLHVDTVQVLKSQNSSRISSQSSLPNAVTKDSLNSTSSVSKSFCFDGSSVSSDKSASVVMKTENNSSGHRQQSAPPPGFSLISKCEIELDASVRTESHTPSVVCGNSRNQQSETELEVTKVNDSHDIESEGRDSVRDTANETSDHGETVKGVSSGVNANFSHTKAPYVQNYYAYSNWPTLPQTFPNFPVMPSFPSVNALAPLSLAPFNVPPIPNPLEFCNMWYYEQCRQQAFLQGLMAHQQMAASAFPPLPPSLYLPQSYSTMSSRNHMNISEVHSPDQSPSMESNLKENSSVSQDACINTATQTEVASLDEGSDTKLTQEKSTGEVCSLQAVSEFIPSDFNPITSEDDSSLLKKCSRNEFLESENKDGNNPDVAPCFKSAVEVSAEVISKDLVENSICGSTFLTNEAVDQSTNKCINDVGLSSQSSVLEDSTKKASSHLFEDKTNLTSVDTSHNCNDSQSKIEKVHESGYLDRESTKEVSAVPNSCVDRSLLEIHNLKDQYCKELPSQTIFDSQRECNTKSARKEIVHEIDNVHHLEESEATKMKGVLKMSQNANNSSAVKSQCTEIEEQEIAQVEFTETPFEEEIDVHEDDCHEQEMIEKAQQEYVMKISAENNRHTTAAENTSREKKAAIHNKLLAREYLDMIKEEKTNSEISSGIQTSICEKYSFESSEKKKFVKGDAKDWLDKFEDTTDHLLEQEHLLTVPQANSCRNSAMSVHGSFQVSQKTSSVSEMLSAELGVLSLSNERQDSVYSRQLVHQSETYREHPGIKAQKQEFHNNLSKVDERIANSVCKAQTNLSKEVQPVIGAKLSSEVSATYISGPTQPAMSQNSHILAQTRSLDQSKDNVSDTLLSCQTASWRTTWSSEELSRNSLQRPSGRDSSRNSPFRNSANQSSTNWHKDSSSGKRITSQQFVKKIYLCSKKIHQINLDGRPYVLTDEIVDYFTPFNGRHVILKILEARKVEINFLELSRRRRPELFECLDRSEIVCRGLNRGPTGNVIGSIHIVPLRSVPYMLRALNKDDEALAMDVKEEMEKFDASDPYWTGCCD